jgi:hypothetical protein
VNEGPGGSIGVITDYRLHVMVTRTQGPVWSRGQSDVPNPISPTPLNDRS